VLGVTWLPVVDRRDGAPVLVTFQPAQVSPYDKLPWLFPFLILAGILYTVVLQLTKPRISSIGPGRS
jgi:hypothetical protein